MTTSKRRVARTFVGLGVLLACSALDTRRASAVVTAESNRIAGPRARVGPAGAVFVESFAELQRAVSDVAGPPEIWLRGKTYGGDLVVKRPVAIHGETGATLEGTGTSTVLAIEANDVAFDNVYVRHSGRHSTTNDAGIKATGERIRIADVRIDDALFGVFFQACHSCAVERAYVQGAPDADALRGDAIKLWEANDSVVRGCVVDHARDVVVWYTPRALVEDNVFRFGRYGTHFMFAHDSIARRNHIEGNVVGIFVMYSARLTIENNVLAGSHGAAGFGVGLKESDAVRIHGNWVVGNTTGVYLDRSPRSSDQPVIFEQNVFALNDVALRLHTGGKGLTFHANDFRNDGDTIEVDDADDALASDVRGNHFSDYEGYDLDRDGIGDVPFRVNALSSELADKHPSLRFFHGTTAMQLVDAIAHAVPVLDGHTLLSDPAPLMQAPEIALP